VPSNAFDTLFLEKNVHFFETSFGSPHSECLEVCLKFKSNLCGDEVKFTILKLQEQVKKLFSAGVEDTATQDPT
jgi:hypothetical protein